MACSTAISIHLFKPTCCTTVIRRPLEFPLGSNCDERRTRVIQWQPSASFTSAVTFFPGELNMAQRVGPAK
jgi:hypothetical protein